jgi:hypothetical protein
MEQKSPLASSTYQMLISVLSSTIQISRDDPREVVGVSGGCGGLLLVGGTDSSATTQTENIQALRAPCNGQVHCANALVKDSYNSLLAAISCAYASIDFLTEITSWSMDSIWRYRCMCVCVRAAKPAHFEGL